MMRRIIQIDEEKCNGCGACAAACHEGAIGMINGKAKLLKDEYCDGLGDCLPACPTDAIRFIEREAAAYNEAAVRRRAADERFGGVHSNVEEADEEAWTAKRLRNWPIQLRLSPLKSEVFDGAELLLAADCTAYAYGAFQRELMRDRAVLIACPKLDQTDYALKLTELLRENDIRSVTLVRMQVPCCGGLAYMLGEALKACGKTIPVRVVTIGMDGNIL